MKRALLALVGLTAAVGFGAWWFTQKPKKLPVVEVAKVVRENISASFTADGLVRGKRYEIQVTGPMRVEAVSVKEGQSVKKGQVLLVLDNESAEAAIREAAGGVDSARADVARANRAVQWARAQTVAQIARAKAELAAAEAKVRSLKSGSRPEDIAQAEHRVEQCRTAADEALKSLNRARSLYREGAVSLADLQRAEAKEASVRQEFEIAVDALALLRAGPRAEDIEAAEAIAQAARAQLSAAQSAQDEVAVRQSEASAATARLTQAQAALARARSLAKEGKLFAPADSVVAHIAIEAGETATPGVPTMTLVDATNLYVEAEIGDEDTAKAQVGQEVAVTVPSAPGRKLSGKIVSLAAEAESKPELSLRTRVVRARIEMTDALPLTPGPSPRHSSGRGVRLRPGMEVDVEGKGVTARSVLTIPSDALFFRDNRNVVLVLTEGSVWIRQVEVGYRTATTTEVISGVREGERVVVSGKEGLKDGTAVDVRGELHGTGVSLVGEGARLSSHATQRTGLVGRSVLGSGQLSSHATQRTGLVVRSVLGCDQLSSHATQRTGLVGRKVLGSGYLSSHATQVAVKGG